MSQNATLETLCLILGDQLDPDNAALSACSSENDAVWMAENARETCHVPSAKSRLVFFLSAMRHYRDELREKGWQVHYTELPHDSKKDRGAGFAEILREDITRLAPKQLRVLEPGDYRVLKELQEVAKECKVPLEIITDSSFFCSIEEFSDWASERSTLVLEHFYRMMRKRHGILMDDSGEPLGGEWNFDKENRKTFGKSGPPKHKAPRSFSEDEITKEVQRLVANRFGDHPGSSDDFDLPVDRAGALALLRDFLEYRFSQFGPYQDAMWEGEAFLFHSRLSPLINVKLLRPQEVIEKAIAAYEESEAPLSSIEGFVRQILGWREYVRGLYWYVMPEYAERNELGHSESIPHFFWSGETEMSCLRDALDSVLRYSYAHHIQRLMVIGQFSLLYGINPFEFHEWHMAMYADAIDWVSLPNVVGMSQFADGGLMATKPYCASGAYINRMSNHCSSCRYNPKKAVGDDACPYTTLYWEFLDRHADTLQENRRMTFQMKNLERKSADELEAIRSHAKTLREKIQAKQEV